MKNPLMFMRVAELFATQSTCCRVKVGAVIVKDGRIISTGFNGVPPGSVHCEDYFRMYFGGDGKLVDGVFEEKFLADHKEFSNKNELHAEENAIVFAARKGVAIEGSSLFVTVSPCFHCAKMIVASGIIQVVYKQLYDRENSVSFLRKKGILVEESK